MCALVRVGVVLRIALCRTLSKMRLFCASVIRSLVVVIVVSGVAVLVAILVNFVDTCVNTKQIFNHLNSIFAIKESSFNVVNFKVFNFPSR